ncbi:MAG TPA: WhiB family transcriptional regulator [Ilumatobacteraceae bacterium]|nr:WhiB family transcriptional regulator [Ilumatobacteraceae bacterium]
MTAAEILDDYIDPSIDWREFAVCKGQLNLFFPRKAERPQARARREAKALRLCTVCVVQSHCRQAARENREYGYWGAESEEDRHMAGFTVSAPIGVRTRLAQQQQTST